MKKIKIVFHMDSQDPYRIKGFEMELIDKPDGIGEAMRL
jgi:hypothetical protein